MSDTYLNYGVVQDGDGGIVIPPGDDELVQGGLYHRSVNGNATTTEGSIAFDVDWITMIANDGSAVDAEPSGSITFNFDAATTSAGAITLNPGEAYKNAPKTCAVLYFKAAYGTQSFRAWGVKRE